MRAVVIRGRWAPRPGCAGSEVDPTRGWARIGNHVWRWPEAFTDDVPLRPPDRGEVVIRVAACGLCGSDRALCQSDGDGYMRYSGQVRLPLVPGHEISGEVVEVGPEVRRLRVGDPVCCDNMWACGNCRACLGGAFNQCQALEELGFTIPGGLAEYVTLWERCCWPVEGILSRWGTREGYRAAALVEPAAVAYQGMFLETDGVPAGGTVVVYGTGPVGLAAVALARQAGAGSVLAFKRRREDAELALQMGANAVFAWEDLQEAAVTPSEVVRDLTGGWGADLQVEAAGAFQQTLPEMLRALAPRGKILLLGRSAQRTSVELEPLVAMAGRLTGSIGHEGASTFPPLIEQMARGNLDLRPMIRRVVGLEEAPRVLGEQAWPSGKTLVEPQPAGGAPWG